MNTGVLIDELRARGVRLEASGDKLRFRAPAGALTPELRDALLEQKPAMLEALRNSVSRAAEVSRRLSAAPGWAAIWSNVLRETVIFQRDEGVTIPPAFERFVSYTRAELEILSTATAPILREIHRVKRASGGRVTALNTIERNPIPSLIT